MSTDRSTKYSHLTFKIQLLPDDDYAVAMIDARCELKNAAYKQSTIVLSQSKR